MSLFQFFKGFKQNLSTTKNGLFQEVYELKSSDGVCRATRILRHDTKSKAIMGTAVAPDGPNFMLAAGMEGLCQLYMLRYKLVTSKDDSPGLII